MEQGNTHAVTSKPEAVDFHAEVVIMYQSDYVYTRS